mmetsp:Transcript_11896/g.17232  ORF Transcript_11896/g.17232 Transcript_11896/m.17232 type:complete len:150 (-) Transcript_11896:192-641(-)
MARSRRGGGGGGLFGSRKAAPARRSAPPARAAPAPPAPQQSSGGGMMSGIGSTIAQGMAFGTGSAIAHRAVGAVAGSLGGGGDAELPQETAVAQQYDGAQQQQMQVCGNEKSMFFDCLKENKGDQEVCRFLYETLQSCQQTGSANMQFS